MTAEPTSSFLWRPEDILSGTSSELKFGLLILNQPVLGDPKQIVTLWKRGELSNDGGVIPEILLVLVGVLQLDNLTVKPDRLENTENITNHERMRVQ